MRGMPTTPHGMRSWRTASGASSAQEGMSGLSVPTNASGSVNPDGSSAAIAGEVSAKRSSWSAGGLASGLQRTGCAAHAAHCTCKAGAACAAAGRGGARCSE